MRAAVVTRGGFGAVAGATILTGAVAGASLIAGALVASGYALEAAVASLCAVTFAVGVANWRASLLGLLLFIPVSGILIVAAYPNTGPAALAKDFLFVLPVYAGFAAYMIRRRVRISFEGAPTVLFGLFALLVLVQAFNPAVPNPLVAAIGVKVWLLYIPLYFVGFHFVRTHADVGRLLRVMCLGAVIPITVGIGEAVLIYAGARESVYALYGDAAASVTQNFAALAYPGGGVLWRVPSTFSSVTQYYAYVATLAAVTYAWWRFPDTGRAARRGLLWVAVLVAAFLSGARAAFLFVPLLVAVMLVLDRRGRPLAPFTLVGVGLAFAAAAAAIGTTAGGAISSTIALARHEFYSIFVEGWAHAVGTTWLGLGTGMDTNAARYASAERTVGGPDGSWFESWHVKVVLELGLLGVVIVALLIGWILLRGLTHHRALRDRGLRAVSAAILAFLAINVVAGVKGQYIDFDPVNVYFWLLAGVLARLPSLDRSSAEDAR